MNTVSVEEVVSGLEEGPLDETGLDGLKSELELIGSDVKAGLFSRRYWADRTRFCIWPGQSPDGRLRSEVLGKEAFPFDGASDGRIRLADEIINERVMVQLAAVLRSHPKVTGMESSDANRAGKIKTLLRWMLYNQIGRNFLTELERVLNYAEGDAPATALMGVYWETETALRSETVTQEGLEQVLLGLAESQAVPVENLQDVLDSFMDPTREMEAAAFLALMVPGVREERALEAVKGIREEGFARFPVPYVKRNMLKLCAHRVLDDVFFPSNTRYIQDARIVLVREWLTRAQVKARRISMGWSEEFIQQVVGEGDWGGRGQAGYTAVPDAYRDIDGSSVELSDMDQHQNEYELWTAYSKAVNDDYEMGVYVTQFHPNVNVAAKDRELLGYAHGDYPFVDFTREHVSGRLMDSRAIPELVQTDQDTMKMLHDGFNDNAQLGMLPPLFKPRRSRGVKLSISPLVEITRARKDDYDWFPPPPYPTATDRQISLIERRMDRYFGRPGENTSPEMVNLIRNHMAAKTLASVSDVMKMAITLALQYLDDEQIQRVVGGNGLPVAKSVDELQGQYDLFLHFDANDLNPEYVAQMIEAIGKVLMYDTENTVMRHVLVQQIMHMINPQLADAAIQPVDAATQSEIEDEMKNFALMFSGVEPPMKESGQNFPLRFNVLNDIVQKNPGGTLERMGESERNILNTRMQHLQFQMEQLENAKIGRTGAAPALK